MADDKLKALLKVQPFISPIPRQNFLYYNKREVMNVISSCYEQMIEILRYLKNFQDVVDSGAFKGDPGDKGNPGDTGVGIHGITPVITTHESGGVNRYTITLTDGSSYIFEVTNGEEGKPGAKGDKGADAVLLQYTGNSTTFGMSQKAITDAILAVEHKAEGLTSGLDDKLSEQILNIKNNKADKYNPNQTIIAKTVQATESLQVKDNDEGDVGTIWFNAAEGVSFTDSTNGPKLILPTTDIDRNQRVLIEDDLKVPYVTPDGTTTKWNLYDFTRGISTNIQEHWAYIQALSNVAYEAKTLAEAKATNYVFDDKAQLDAWLAIKVNKDKLKVGDNLFIRAIDVPDYWWDGTQIQVLETQKVDLSHYIKDTDYASSSKAGIVKITTAKGITVDAATGELSTVRADNSEIKARTNTNKPIVPSNLNYAVKIGITENEQILTNPEQVNAQKWLGIKAITFDEYSGLENKTGINFVYPLDYVEE